jgi:hypothetical protein
MTNKAMKLKIIDTAHHRNGVAGTPFDVVLFKVQREDGVKVGILFDDPGNCAVLDVVASVNDLMCEARNFLPWYIERATIVSFMELTIQDIDAYFEMRAPGLRRKSRKDVAQRLRSLVRYLHSTGRTATDLAPQIIAPILYAYETIPSALSSEQIAAVLKTTGEDTSPMGLRDYAILQLLSTYGMRDGEITGLAARMTAPPSIADCGSTNVEPAETFPKCGFVANAARPSATCRKRQNFRTAPSDIATAIARGLGHSQKRNVASRIDC